MFNCSSTLKDVAQQDDDDDVGDKSDAEDGVVATAISGKQAVQHIDGLKKYALQRGLDNILDLVTQATDIIYKEEMRRKSELEQGSLDSWLNT